MNVPSGISRSTRMSCVIDSSSVQMDCHPAVEQSRSVSVAPASGLMALIVISPRSRGADSETGDPAGILLGPTPPESVQPLTANTPVARMTFASLAIETSALPIQAEVPAEKCNGRSSGEPAAVDDDRLACDIARGVR